MTRIDLTGNFGFPVFFDEESKILNFNGREMKPDIRRLKDMESVLYNKQWYDNVTDEGKETGLYFMFRGAFKDKKDESRAKKEKLRYDITVIPFGTLGDEYNKTLGHFHPRIKKDEDITYPEVYEVLKGRALFLFQKMAKWPENKIEDVYLVEGKEGDVVIVPPNYGHITINTDIRDKETLVLANWTESTFKSDYGPIKEYHGGVFFVLKKNIVKNPRYDCPFMPRIIKAKNDLPKNMYSLVDHLEDLEFLKTGILPENDE